jgi:hypothetical protein
MVRVKADAMAIGIADHVATFELDFSVERLRE